MYGRDTLIYELRDFLVSSVGKQFEIGEAPENPVLPYGIIYPLDSPAPDPDMGSWTSPEEDRDVRVQFTMVGRDHRQVLAISDATARVMLDEDAYPFTPALPPGVSVQWRRSEGLGSTVPSGEKLFQSADTYAIRIGA